MSLVFEPSRYPTGPGCYLMRDAAGAVLYVGKAKNLRKRLTSHFGAGGMARRRSRLLAALAEIELILVLNETEALILENNLIKLYQPRANRVLLDADEGYFYVGLTDEQLPRLVAYRKHRINKALERGSATTTLQRSFGPYVSRKFRDSLLSYIVDNFKLRTCAPLPGEVCLRFHLGACGGVCEGYVSDAEYAHSVADAVGFLSRPHADMIRQMERDMADCAAELRFEQAARIKHHITLLTGALEPQVVEREVRHDQNVLYFGGDAVMTLCLVAGVLQGCTFSVLDGVSPDEFLVRRYASGCPGELIVNLVGDLRCVEELLTRATKGRVRVTLARAGPRGVAQRLMAIAALNFDHRAAQQSASATARQPRKEVGSTSKTA